MTHAICTVGLPGAGKSVVEAVASELGLATITMGDCVRKRAAAEGVGESGNSLSNSIGEWVTEQREIHGKGVVSEWVIEALSEEHNTVLIDGLRSPEEYERFTDTFETTTLIHIKSPLDVRSRRLRERGRDGEEQFSDEEFKKRDERELEWGVGELLPRADHQITNGEDTSLVEFREKIEDGLRQITSQND